MYRIRLRDTLEYMGDNTVFVSVLLKQYQSKAITLEQFSKALQEDVEWDYIYGYPSTKSVKGNTWARLHDAFSQRKLSLEDYMYLAQSYEEYRLAQSLLEE